MYLWYQYRQRRHVIEGSPAGLKKSGAFIAYEAEWRTPVSMSGTCTHEYVHYLDGRYNLFGDFSRGTSANTIWWIEGLSRNTFLTVTPIPRPLP